MASVKDILVKSVTAGTTQTQAGATLADGDFNIVTVANSSDGVILPQAAKGTVIWLKGGANNGKLYATGSGTIDGTAGATGVTLTASRTAVYVATADTPVTTWVSLAAALQ